MKSLINTPQAVRYTIATFTSPILPNSDTLYQGGSSACDVFPGTNATFGGEINGYGEITGLDILSVNDYTIYYVYNGINPIVEYSANGSILARYIYSGGDLHIAKIAGADTHFYHCDALGSPRVMTDENAVIKWQARYWPFGEMTKWGIADNTHGFTPLEISPLMYRGEDFVFVLRFLTGQAGKEWDSEMGLNYPVFSLILKDNKGNEDPALRDFCQRYYDPEIGRFITLDPFSGYIELPQTQNRYAYCMNNPLKYIDPLGLWVDDDVYYLAYQNEDYECWVYGGYIDIEAITSYWYNWGYWGGFGNTGILGGGAGDPYDDYGYPGGGKGSSSHGHGGSSGSGKKGGFSVPWVPGHPILGQLPMPNAMGWVWQAGFTLNEGIEVGLNEMWGQGAEGMYGFGETNEGGACGTNLGVVCAWGAGSWEGLFANLNVSIGPFSVTYFESGKWKGFSIGLGIGPPAQVTGGLAYFFRIR